MAVDKCSAGSAQLALSLLRRILAEDDLAWVHEQAGGDRLLVRQFRAKRRRSFYGCVRMVHREAREVQKRWAQAAERAKDYSGADGPLDYVRLLGVLGLLVVTAELRFLLGYGFDGAVQGLLSRLEEPMLLKDATIPAI